MAGQSPSLVVKVAANLDDLQASMKQVESSIDHAAESVSDLGDKGSAGMQRLKQATDDAGQSTSMLTGLQNELGQIFAVSKLVAFGNSVLELGDHLVKVSDQTGLTIEQVQKLEYVAQQSGSGMDAMTSAVQNLEARLGSSDSGTIKAIEDLGLKMEDFTQLNAYDQFLQVAEAIRQIQDPTEQAAAAAAVFGRNWKEILPAIKSGMQETADAAATMSDATARKLDQLGDRMAALHTRLQVWAAGTVDFIDKAGEAVGQYLSSFDPSHWGVTNAELLRHQESLSKIVDVTKEGAQARAAAKAATDADTAATHDNTNAADDNTKSKKQQVAEEKAYKAVLDDMDKTTFQLAMQHQKQWRDEIEKTLNARNKAVADALTTTKAAELDLADYMAKQALSSTDYQIKKINDWVDAQLAAYDKTLGNYDRFAAAILGKAELQKQALIQKTVETQQAIDAIMPDSAIGHKGAHLNENGVWVGDDEQPIASTGGRTAGGNIALGGIADLGAAMKAFYDSFIGNSAGTPGVGSYGNAAGPAGWNMPRFASGGSVSAGRPVVVGEAGPEVFVPSVAGAVVPNGASVGGTSIVQHITITQPLGSARAIADAVGAATLASMQNRGERFRPSGV